MIFVYFVYFFYLWLCTISAISGVGLGAIIYLFSRREVIES